MIGIHPYVLAQAEVQSNSIKIQRDLFLAGFSSTVVNLGPPIDRLNWFNMSRASYFEATMTALRHHIHEHHDEYCLLISGDIHNVEWSTFIKTAASILKTANIGAYAPFYNQSPFNISNTSLGELPHVINHVIASNSDSAVVILNPDIVQYVYNFMLYLDNRYGLSKLKYNWGLDIIFSVSCFVFNRYIVRTVGTEAKRGSQSSINLQAAADEMQLVLQHFFKYCKSQGVLDSEAFYVKMQERFRDESQAKSVFYFYKDAELFKDYIKSPLYHVISISNDRSAEIEKIRQILGDNRVEVESVNGKVSKQVADFYKERPQLKHIENPPLAKGEVGCYLSHYAAWEYAAQNNLNGFLIFEDDAELNDSFIPMYNRALALLPENYDVFSMYVDRDQHGRFDNAQRVDGVIAKGYQDWSLIGYFVSSAGAKKLLDITNTNGLNQPADWALFRNGHAGNLNVYTWDPATKLPMAINRNSIQQTIR